MKKYLVKLIFQVTIDGKHDHFDEQLRMVLASGAPQALEEATGLGAGEACDFLNLNLEKVRWRFVEVCDIIELNSFENGQLLCSVSNTESDCEGYMRYLKQRALAIREKHLNLCNTT